MACAPLIVLPKFLSFPYRVIHVQFKHLYIRVIFTIIPHFLLYYFEMRVTSIETLSSCSAMDFACQFSCYMSLAMNLKYLISLLHESEPFLRN
jgi:hypothetical protein